jgi:hypothetical protein
MLAVRDPGHALIQYLKRIIGVKKSAASSDVRGEFGRQPVVMNLWSVIIKFTLSWRSLTDIVYYARLMSRANI